MAVEFLFIEGWGNDVDQASLLLRYPGLGPLVRGSYTISTSGGVLENKPYLDWTTNNPVMTATSLSLVTVPVQEGYRYVVAWWGRDWVTRPAGQSGSASLGLMGRRVDPGAPVYNIQLHKLSGGGYGLTGSNPIADALVPSGAWAHYELILDIADSQVIATLTQSGRVIATYAQPYVVQAGDTITAIFPRLGSPGAVEDFSVHTGWDSFVVAQIDNLEETLGPVYVSSTVLRPPVGEQWQGPAGQTEDLQQFIDSKNLASTTDFVDGLGQLALPFEPRPGWPRASRIDVQASTGAGEELIVGVGSENLQIQGSTQVATATVQGDLRGANAEGLTE